MRADGIEITQNDALEVGTGIDNIGDNLLRNLLGVTIGRCGLLYR